MLLARQEQPIRRGHTRTDRQGQDEPCDSGVLLRGFADTIGVHSLCSFAIHA